MERILGAGTPECGGTSRRVRDPWDVFDPEEQLLGTVLTPGLRVTQLGVDFLVGTWTDELDVPHVWACRLEKHAPDESVESY